MKISIKGFITCKSAEQYIDCADNYAFNKWNHRFSISDGVSRSFFPKIWSEILVRYFVDKINLNENELIIDCQKEWQNTIDKIVSSPNTKWFTKTQYNRKDPALATFVGLQFFEKEKKWSASALGDSFLFFLPSNYSDYQKELIKLSSKPEPLIFDNFPDYLTSISDTHKGKPRIKSGSLRNGTFYLMTDALAEWFLNEGEKVIGQISTWQNQLDFEKCIYKAIHERQMTNDDSAILSIEITESENEGIEYNKIQVTDLNDLINQTEKEKNKEIEEEKEKKLGKEKEEQTVNDSEDSIIKTNEAPSQETDLQKTDGLIIKGLKRFKKILIGKEKKETPVKVSEGKESDETRQIENDEIPEVQNNPEKKIDEPSNENEQGEIGVNNKKEAEDSDKKTDETQIEKVEEKEQPILDSKAKIIFDKF